METGSKKSLAVIDELDTREGLARMPSQPSGSCTP
jgi:hypothetical protein